MGITNSELLNQVRAYVRSHGEGSNTWSTLDGDQYRYDVWGNVRVAVSTMTAEMEVEKIDNLNPVACLDGAGVCYRFHGEFDEVRSDLWAMINR